MTHSLVTGANRGLGLEFVRQLLARGERVIATCRQPERAAELTRLSGDYPGHLTVMPLALPDPRAIAALMRDIEALDSPVGCLINNAGMLVPDERYGSIEANALQDSFAANAQGPFLLTQALAPRLSNGARVLNISSGLASIAGATSLFSPSYSISKAALNMATKLTSIALADRSIVVIALSPGWVSTDMGGANASLTPTQSITAMLRVIDGLRIADSGRFLAHTGEPIDW
ncbi:MAG: SDR family oxidoreductase [Dokdonella sp.]|uniref:SDR family oxidoreductase n=1 Tax=Dokdonella sp. TaxID=2291710 RepID=UPI0032636975